MKEKELEQYQMEPYGMWGSTLFHGDGYIVMGQAEQEGWETHAGWRGIEVGSWPYIMYFSRPFGEGYHVVEYVERDVTMYACSNLSTYYQLMDTLAFRYWKYHDTEWVQGCTSIEQIKGIEGYPPPKDHVVLCQGEDHHLHLLDGPISEKEAQKSVRQLNIVPGTNAFASHINDVILPTDGSDIVYVQLSFPFKVKKG